MQSFLKSNLLPPLAIAASLVSSLHGEQEPQRFETLTTARSRTYKAVTVREITPSGVKILHESGTATIPYQELPADVQRKLGGFDAAAADRHREEVEANLRKQEASIDGELKRIDAAKRAQIAPSKPSPSKAPAFMPAASPAPGMVPPAFPLPGAVPAAPAPGPKEPGKAEKGILSVRIVGYDKGNKRIEIKADTNCGAKVKVHGALEFPSDFDVSPRVPFSRQIRVLNHYSVDLYSDSGRKLDTETWNEKTDTFKKTTLDGATLR